MNPSKCNPEYYRLLKDISIISFTLVDLCLFLDTHPKGKIAMEYYHHYNKILKQLKMEFSEKYFPLSLSYVKEDNKWTWGDAMLPWEGGM